jgi:branched-chain amino acid transport system substrate-binding protein
MPKFVTHASLSRAAVLAALLLFGGRGALAQDIAVATAGPMTGEFAAFGEQMKRGAEMAVSDLNAKGGVLGRQLHLEVGDDQCDPKQAVAVANQLAGKKVVFVGGHFCSSSSIPASEVYNDAGIIQLTPASTNPALTDEAAKKKWANVFRVCGRDDQRSSTTSRPTAKASPTRPRRRSMPAASRRPCTSRSRRATKISARSSAR